MTVPKNTDAKEAEARRQGQFEGQVLTTLADMKRALDSIVASSAAFDSRLRNVETTVVKHDDQLRETALAHEDLYKKIEGIASIMSNLVSFQDKAQGFRSATTWIASIASSIFTGVIVYFLTH